MYLTASIIVITSVFSYLGFRNERLVHKYSFSVGQTLRSKEYYRLLTSGFLHVNWLHLVINMFALFSFGSGVEAHMGIVRMLLLYSGSIAGGNLFSLFIHKHQPYFSSVGASGGVSGLVFATIALFPEVKFFFIPLWIVGVVYVVYTFYAIRSQRQDIGHAAHLGGGLTGMLIALLFFPEMLLAHWLPILCILVPALTLLWIMVFRPHLIYINKADVQRTYTMDDRYNIAKHTNEKEVNRILEKINEHGIDSLTRKERAILEAYSQQT